MDVLLFGIRKFRNVDQQTGETFSGYSLQYAMPDTDCVGFRGRQKGVYSTDVLYSAIDEIYKTNTKWPVMADFQFGPWNSILSVSIK